MRKYSQIQCKSPKANPKIFSGYAPNDDRVSVVKMIRRSLEYSFNCTYDDLHLVVVAVSRSTLIGLQRRAVRRLYRVGGGAPAQSSFLHRFFNLTSQVTVT